MMKALKSRSFTLRLPLRTGFALALFLGGGFSGLHSLAPGESVLNAWHGVGQALAQDKAGSPDELVENIILNVVQTVQSDKAVQAGDVKKVMALIDEKVMPHVNFQRMTAQTVGPQWRQASAEQKQKLQAEFKVMLVRVYAGALSQVKPDTKVELRPSRDGIEGNETIVRTEVRGKGEPIKMDYRLEKAGNAWRIYDVNIGGIWLIENYKSSFREEITKGGLDGLIQSLSDKNKAAASKG